jgi:hypothetical protein
VESLEGTDKEPAESTAIETGRKRKPSRKVVTVIAVAILLGASGFYVWYEYYRHWSAEELSDAVNLVDERGPIIMGFKPYLAGRTVTVEADISHISTMQTTLGELNLMYLQGAKYVGLMQWGACDYEAGDRVVMDVSFQWAVINGIEGVFSPQATLGLGMLEAIQVVNQAVSWVSSEWVIGVGDNGDDVIVRIERASEPLPLDTSALSIKAGTNVGAMEYVDLLGFYRDAPYLDTILNLGASEGENGTVVFSDTNGDGYLDDGDAFTLRNLTRPDTECGAQTYLLWVERDHFPGEPDRQISPPGVFYAYIVMTTEGVLWTTSSDTPVGTSFLTPAEDGVSLTVQYMSEPVRWNDTDILIADGTNFVRWHPDQASLASGAGASFNCGVKDVGDISLECIVTDVQGDGHAGVGDTIELRPRNGTSFEEGYGFEIGLRYLPNGGQLAWKSFVYGAVPTSECSPVVENARFEATFTPVYNGTERNYSLMDVKWDEVAVTIDDGTNMVEWQLDGVDLDSGERILWTSSNATLGALVLRCIVTDLQGNGLVNSGDSLQITVVSAGGFDTGTGYTAAVHYLPTDTDMYSLTFDL